ncbi:family 43 glycosylhydrolase [Teredinibacter turnerae]|uniref:family 43 glycosylhydrolase n=1 Tax=Teredinibacter turnerae TaxID=2426 RepID=UPI0003FA9A4A|nr:family 43 glycosylhydrolase [Teredinibacter turnerae]
MKKIKRRTLFKGIGASALPLPAFGGTATSTFSSPQDPCKSNPPIKWGVGVEGQRKADLGNGRYLNPIVPGDHPDPTVLKDGDDYYMTFSSFNSYPGITIWHSKDLVNWVPIGSVLHQYIGTVWALDICKVGNRYYVYIPAAPEGKPWSIYVIWTDDIRGKWSDPIDLKIEGCIDPGHAVGEDGKRYLFVNGIRKVRLTDDGLATDGTLVHAYDPWRYPENWVVENFAPEGPKLLRKDDWFYLVTAVGGTAGPVTGHMVIAARSKSIHGPWEHCPNNPLVRTVSDQELWWSKGHATLVEGPHGNWYMVYHAYENGFRTLGRQTLLEPIEWTEDGWFRAIGGDLSLPLAKPADLENQPNGSALSDEFSTNKFGVQWVFHEPKRSEKQRVTYKNDALVLKAAGTSPADSSPLVFNVPDRSYQVEVDIEIEPNAEGGLMVFYNHKAFVGVGFTETFVKNYQYAEEHPWARVPVNTKRVRARMVNNENVLTFYYSHDKGKTWRLHPTRMEVSGLHHNVFGGFLALRVGLFSVGGGQVEFGKLTYSAL